MTRPSRPRATRSVYRSAACISAERPCRCPQRSRRARAFPRRASCRASRCSSFVDRHAGTRQHARALHMIRRAEHDRHVDAPLRRRSRTVTGSRARRAWRRSSPARAGNRSRPSPPWDARCISSCFSVSGVPATSCASSARSTLPCRVDAGKRRFDRRNRLALIEPVHAASASNTGMPALREMRGRGRFAHADRAGQSDDEHHCAPSVAATCARSSGVTSGRTPNQRSKPGTA